MTIKMERNPIVSNIKRCQYDEHNLPTEQEAFQAAIQKHTAISKIETMQIESTSSWKTYYSHHLKQQITYCEANFLGDYIHNKVWKTIKPQLPLVAEYNLEPSKEKEKINTYLTGMVQMHNVGAKTFCIDQRVGKEAAVFNDWCNNTDDWPIEEIIPANETWPELVTESEEVT
ncbi:33938_t:CDS:2 [Gigaspora margarita]|uniref:33938_t:CDS:1 n=1 Tax=Gigaspora margarita TaxID=4874 RepID=A0ABM8W4L7_GIGMA|nr:33938_t:CDS:2 [Gigaspora margarita]